jgi:glutathione S-transferase
MLLYHSLTSPYARKVRVVLLEKDVTHEAIDVATSDKQPATHNPLGKVPTLVLDDGTVLFDSTVIAEALDALYPSPRLIPEAPLERAAVRRWEALADGICDVVIPVIVDSRRPEPQRDPVYCAKLLGKVRAGLAHLEASLVGRRFLQGECFSLADIAVVVMAGYLKLRRPELLKDAYPELQRYLAEQSQRKSLADTVPPNLPVRG